MELSEKMIEWGSAFGKNLSRWAGIFLLVCMGAGAVPAQFDKLADKGHAAFRDHDYEQAIKIYNKSLARQFNKQARLNLATAYRYLHRFPEAIDSYAKIIQLNKFSPRRYLEFADLLLREGAVPQAAAMVSRYLVRDSTHVTARALAESLLRRDEFFRDSQRVHIARYPYNASQSDLHPVWWDDTLAFLSNRNDKKNRQPYTWHIPQPYVLLTPGRNDKPIEIDLKGLKSDLWGPIAVDTVHDELFVTVLGAPRDKVGDKQRMQLRMNIYYAAMTPDGLGLFRSLPINNVHYNVGHPALSPDGNRLYFVSDNPDGAGGTDLYYTERQPGGPWSEPVALPPSINSPGNELFPTVDTYGTLLFSSDGWGGLGGLDIFYTDGPTDQELVPVNLGAPINSSMDDYGLLLAPFPDEGYFASERTGRGDLYSVHLDRPLHTIGVALKTNARQLKAMPVVAERTDSELIDGFFSDTLDTELPGEPPVATSDPGADSPYAQSDFLASDESSEVIDVVVADSPPRGEAVEADVLGEEVEAKITEVVPDEVGEESAEITGMAEEKIAAEAEEMIAEEAPVEVVEEVPAEEMIAEEAPVEVVEEVPAEEMIAEEAPEEVTEEVEEAAEEMIAEEAPEEVAEEVEEAAEEMIAEEAPEEVAEEVPAEEMIAEEAPVEVTEEVEEAAEEMIAEEAVATEELDGEMSAATPTSDPDLAQESAIGRFSVQLGAFSRTPAPEFFEQLGAYRETVWTAERNGITIYRLGHIQTRELAERNLDRIRGMGFPDAFIYEAPQPSFGPEEPAPEEAIAEKTPPETTEEPDPTVANPSGAPTEEVEMAPEESTPASLPAMTDRPVYFTVQIGAFRAAPDAAFRGRLGPLGEQLWVQAAGDFQRYNIGKFSNFSEALGALRQAKETVPDAFLTAYENGEKITVELATQKMQR